MDKLERLIAKQQEISEGLKSINEQVAEARTSVVNSRGKDLFESILGFADLFTTGVVHEAFEAIREQMVKLEEVDPNYLSTIGSGDPYEVKGVAGVKYIVPYLLGSKWRKDANLWAILGQISDTIDLDGNPFAGGGDG